MLRCCVAVMAYNEETNIENMLKALCQQQLRKVSISEIIVVASGCTDRTEEIVREFCLRDSRIRLISQRRRNGKSAAINTLLQHTHEEIIVLVNADTMPAPDAIEHLVAPFEDPEVGMTGGHPVPTNDSSTFMGYIVHLMWQLHHAISLRHPKMGELVAFRNLLRQIPPDSAVDEASIEPLIKDQRLRLVYVPEVFVYNRGPETVSDFIKQRRRIYVGHLYVQDTTGYQVSTLSGIRILPFFLRAAEPDRRYFFWAPWAVVLEVLARLLATWDYRVRKRKHCVWDVVKTTKKSIQISTSDDPRPGGHATGSSVSFWSKVFARIRKLRPRLGNKKRKPTSQAISATTVLDREERSSDTYVHCYDAVCLVNGSITCVQAERPYVKSEAGWISSSSELLRILLIMG